jgi:enoyl-CoA hydratase/carnithine racemase
LAQTHETIETRIDGRVGVITLNRPQVLNAINRTLMDEVTAAMDSFIADPKVLAIVLHGNGRAFSAGFDMKESAQRAVKGIEQWREVLGADFDFLIQFWDSPKPTVAAVHGFALAGGCEMALSCDITIAAEGTRFGEPEPRFGSGIIALLLPWMTTPKFAKEMRDRPKPGGRTKPVDRRGPDYATFPSLRPIKLAEYLMEDPPQVLDGLSTLRGTNREHRRWIALSQLN